VYPNIGFSTLDSSVQLRCRLHCCVEKLFRTPPHFGMTPLKSGAVLAKCAGGPKKICSLRLQKLDPPTLKTVATPLHSCHNFAYLHYIHVTIYAAYPHYTCNVISDELFTIAIERLPRNVSGDID